MILLFHGGNTYAARAKIRELTDRYKSKSGDFGLERFWGADPDISAEKIVASITSVPFLADSRLVIIEDLLKNKPVAEKVLPALERVPDSTVVVVYEPDADRRTKLFKDLAKQAKTAEFKALDTRTLTNWVRKRAQDLDAEIDAQTAAFLIEHTGEDQWRLENEVAKLAHSGQPIDRDLIRDIVEPTFSQTIFNLTDSLSSGNTAKALELYEGLRASRAEPIYIVTMMGWQLRNLLLVKTGNKPPAAVAKEAGMSPFVASKAAPMVNRIGLRELKEAYSLVADLDYKLKTSSVASDALVEEAIYQICTRLGKPSAAISS